MPLGRTRVSFVAGALSVIAACSSATGSSSSGSASPTLPPCPASFADVPAASCSVEGQTCTFLAPCVTFAANASCVCAGGRFVCTGFGDAGTACPALGTTEMCPMTERAASGLFCSELGLVCTYPSACAGIPAYDSCQCVGGRTASEGPHFECRASCVPTGDAAAVRAPDASVPDAMAADDAPASPAPSTDGASE